MLFHMFCVHDCVHEPIVHCTLGFCTSCFYFCQLHVCSAQMPTELTYSASIFLPILLATLSVAGSVEVSVELNLTPSIHECKVEGRTHRMACVTLRNGQKFNPILLHYAWLRKVPILPKESAA